MTFVSVSRRLRSAVSWGLILALILASAAVQTGTQADDVQFKTLEGHLPPILSTSRMMARVNSQETINLALALPIFNQALLTDFLQHLYTPGDPLYHQYLTPEVFADRFGASQADYDAVAAYARANGLKVTGTHSNRLLLDVSGPSSAVEKAFGTRLFVYQAPNGQVFRAPEAEPVVPATIGARLKGVIGLDTAAVWKTHNRQRPDDAVQPHANPNQIGTGPGGGLTPANIKNAYNLTGTSLNGAGQTLAVFELAGYTLSDITFYQNSYALPAMPLQNVLVDGYSGAPGNGADEVTLDIELMMAIAPGAAKMLVYEGPNSNAGVVDTYSKIATDNLAKQISTSWGLAEGFVSTSVLNSENASFQQMAAQGQSIYAASGDSGAYDNGSSLSVDDPASQPFMTGVGGTTLSVVSAGGAWKSEKTWNSGSISAGAGGGGISTRWAIPSYQVGVVSVASKGSSTARNVPDVALDADPNTGYSIYYAGGWRIYGGTSCAAPLWAGFTALVNQQRITNGSATLGFANPMIYTIGKSANYAADFHDIADGSTNLFYPAVTGYDDATGWGTFNGAALLTDLIGTAAPPTTYQINSGGPAVGTFSADNFFTSGTVYAFSNPVDISGVTNPAPAAVYQSLRYLNPQFGYTLPNLTATGSYKVRLHFVEVAASSPGGRVFNVSINGTQVLSNFDIFAAAGGQYKAVVKEFNVNADANGKINLNFVSAGSAGPCVSAVEVLTAAPTAPDVPTGLKAVPGNAQVALTWSAASGATTYNLYRSTSSGGEGTTPYKTGLTSASYTDTAVTNGTTYFYKVTAVNTVGESAQSSEASATPSSSAPVYQINSGGQAVGTFSADNFYTSGTVYAFSNPVDISGVTNPAPAAVYQSLRYLNPQFGYVLPNLTANGAYKVRLHFVEVAASSAGGRVFNVSINGTQVLSNFDIFAAAGGQYKAVVKEFNVNADANGKINLNFVSASNAGPCVSAVEIVSGP